jgi:hypothetical protein
LNICLEAIIQNPESLKYIINQTEDICLTAVKKDGLVLKYVLDQTHKVCFEAIINNPYSIEYVKEQNIELCNLAASLNPETHKYFNIKVLKNTIISNCYVCLENKNLITNACINNHLDFICEKCYCQIDICGICRVSLNKSKFI